MSMEVAALAGCAAGVAYAVWRHHQIGVLGLVALYAAIVARIVLTDLTLLMPALGLAIAMAFAALVIMLRRDVTRCDEVRVKETSEEGRS